MDQVTIQLNGESRTLSSGVGVQGLIDDLDLGSARFAVEVNGTLVPRSTYAAYPLQSGDQVEIVHAIGGG